ncbi:ZBED5 protein, partial [Polyodon spathula]|nr:ZBED5 protein [Polyodon spathula]
MKNVVCTPASALKASFQVAYHIAKNKRPYTSGEKLISTTVSRQISDMSENIKAQLISQLKKAHLIAYVLYCQETSIKEDFLFCKPIKMHATGSEMFNILNNFLTSHELKWETCVGICTDRAPSVSGGRACLKAKVFEIAPHILWTHCMIHHEALATRKMDPTKACLFAILCAEMGEEHNALLFHMEVRWLSKGKVLQCVYDLRNEV